ncbi:hypothetical protein [Halonatronum saccharophilum]|uniref:hypothetical protein n=1 Tax=Halonatronum saccharophilum TaxID=150060 RepID=UPI0004804F3D|nr:hypothetical protein [Halonatronum saccharophilum]
MCDKYSGKIDNEAMSKVENWVEEFKLSDLFTKLSSSEQEVAPFIIDSFSTFMYNYLDLEPKDWNWLGVKECCLNIIPKKVMGDESYFKGLGPVLREFFRFLEEKKILDKGQKLSLKVEKIGSKVVKMEKDDENWGIGKHIYSLAEKMGINIEDEKELDNFIEYYNKVINKSSLSIGDEYENYNLIHDNLMNKMVSFFYEVKDEFSRVFSEYYLDFLEIMGEVEEEISEDLKFLFMQLVFFDYKIDKGKSLIELFLERRANQLPTKEEEILRGWIDLRLSIYQVISIESTNTCLLSDYMRGSEIFIIDDEFDYVKGDLILARISELWGENRLVGPVRMVPADYSYIIFDEAKKALNIYRKDSRDMSIDSFLGVFSTNLLGISKQINTLLNDYTRVYEARYRVQSRSFTKNKLKSQPNVEIESSLDELDHLVWLDKESNIYGDFMIDEDHIFFRSHNLENYNKGKDLIKKVLVFTASLEDEYIVDLEGGEILERDDLSERGLEKGFVDKFINTPLEEIGFEGGKPIEMIKNKEGRSMIEDFLDKMELVITFMGSDNLFNFKNIDQIRSRLGLEGRVGPLFKDEVERLLAHIMVDDFDDEEAYNSINLWRIYKEKVGEVRGRANSWASGIAYLLNLINDWGYTQKEIGESYGVTPSTVSNKYRHLDDLLKEEIKDIFFDDVEI